MIRDERCLCDEHPLYQERHDALLNRVRSLISTRTHKKHKKDFNYQCANCLDELEQGKW